MWRYRNIFFSKHGSLRKTISALIDQSIAGLSAFDLNDLVGVPAHSLLSQLKNNTGLYREKHQSIFIYFSSQLRIFERQRDAREKVSHSTAKRQLPSDKDAVVILAEFIKHTEDSVEKSTRRVRRRGIAISANEVHSFLIDHGIKKNPDWL